RPAAGPPGRGRGGPPPTLPHTPPGGARGAAAAAGRDPLERLAVLGGCEHAAGVGVLLAAAARRVPVVLDGLISAATAVLAVELEPRAHEVLIAGHRSPEPGASAGLAALQLDPVLDLELRVGEGTGGALAVGVIRAATRLLHEVATLAEVTAGPAQRPE
ncbi:MAG: nicotinate-nucleotide--dimethylbenzimidazole phosphoribosyltransferase, partial [Nitriliruptoraceae bacterium]|nr:nicotinate-nucleotide--dimethylbenzimidazole phosphoribosyltransferase [Nitriliruptoraceae bacterium]